MKRGDGRKAEVMSRGRGRGLAFVSMFGFALGVASCSSGSMTQSSTDPGTNGSPSGNGNGGPGDNGSSGSGQGAASPLVGTWDIVYTVAPTSGTATLILSATSFALTAAGTDIAADMSGAVPEITGRLGKESEPVATTHVKSPVDFGQIPIDIGGTWNFHGAKTGSCRGDVSAQLLSLDCLNLASPLSDILAEYDYTEKKTTGTGLSNAQRISKADSIFGELGGTWRAVAPRAVCDVTFEGAQMKASCTKNDTAITPQKDVFTLTFDGAIVSGTSEAGGELSARRR